MFLESSAKPIAENLLGLVSKIEMESPGLRVLAGKTFCYPVEEVVLNLTISESRRFNVLEEFVLRAARDIQPAVGVADLAGVLGLDTLFVATTARDLVALGCLQPDPAISLLLTPNGERFYAQGALPARPRQALARCHVDPFTGEWKVYENEKYETAKPHVPDLTALGITSAQSFPDDQASVSRLVPALQECGLTFHAPEEGRIVTDVAIVSRSQVWKTITLLLMHDLLDERRTRIQARDGSGSSATLTERFQEYFDSDIETWLDHLELARTSVTLELEVEPPVENGVRHGSADERRAFALQAEKAGILALAGNGQESGSVRILRDDQIRGEFLGCFDQAQHDILLFSPWISEKVVDDELLGRFRRFVKRGGIILIGYGIGRDPGQDDKPAPVSVLEALDNVKTREELPGVLVHRLGNSHAKEIIVDRQRLLTGSFNWLSYRGHWLPRGETVTDLTLLDQVESAWIYYANRFAAKAESDWATGGSEDALRALGTWFALHKYDVAAEAVITSNNLTHLVAWVGYACQRLQTQAPRQLISWFGPTIQRIMESPDGSLEDDRIRRILRTGFARLAMHDFDAALGAFTDTWWPRLDQSGDKYSEGTPRKTLEAWHKEASNLHRAKATTTATNAVQKGKGKGKRKEAGR